MSFLGLSLPKRGSFLGNVANDIGGVATTIAKPASNLADIDVINPARQLAAQASNNPVAYQHAVQAQNAQLQPRQFANTIGQVGLDAAGGPLAHAGETLAGRVAARAIPKIATDIAGRAVANAVVGSAASGLNSVGANEKVTPGTLAKGALKSLEFSLPGEAVGIVRPGRAAIASEGGREISPTATQYAAENTTKQIHENATQGAYSYDKSLKGGQLQQDGSGGYTRTTEHSPFYSNFYKENGRAPTQKDFATEVSKQLHEGGGDLVAPEESDAFHIAQEREGSMAALQQPQAAPPVKPIPYKPVPGVNALDTSRPDWQNKPVQDGGIVGANYTWDTTRDQLAKQLRDNAKQDMADSGLAGRLKFTDWQKAAEQQMHQDPKFQDLAIKKQLEADVNDTGRKKLLEKLNSPEYSNSTQIGQHLSNVRDAKTMINQQLRQAKVQYSRIRKAGNIPGMRTAGKPVLALKQTIQNLENMERDYSRQYAGARQALDERFPDVTLERSGKKVVQGRAPISQKAAQELADKYVPRQATPEAEPQDVDLSDYQGYQPDKPTESYAGPNVNEGAFGPDDIAKLEQQIKDHENAGPRSADADRAWLESIMNGDSNDVALSRASIAGGLSSDAAKSQFGDDTSSLLGIDEHTGAPSNNPLYGTVKIPDATGADWQRGVLNRQAVTAQLEDARQLAGKEIDKLSPEDQELLHQLRGSDPDKITQEAQNPEQFAKTAAAIKHANDLHHAAGEAVGQSVPYRLNYGARQFFKIDSQHDKDSFDQLQARVADRPAYAKSRTFANYDEAKKLDLQPLHSSFKEDLMQDLKQRQSQIGELTLAKGLKEAYHNDVSLEAPSANANGTFKQLSIQGGRKIFADSKLADQINHRSNFTRPPGIAGAPGKLYDTVGGLIKSVRLSLGLFHDLNTFGAYFAQQLASGKLRNLLAPLHAKISPEYYNGLVNSLRDNGSLDKLRLGGLVFDTEKMVGEGRATLLAKGKYNPLAALHRSLFEREIPTMKLVIGDGLVRDLDPTNSADLVEIRKIAKGLNDGFGGQNRAVDGLTPKQAHWVGRFALAPDYEEGQIRSIVNAVSKGGVDGKLARQIMFGRMAMFAVPGILAAGLSGNLKTPEDWGKAIVKQFINPTIPTPFKKPASYPGGPREREVASFPGNPISKATRIVSPLFSHGTQDPFSGIAHEVTGNANPLISAVNQFATNQDYYGNALVARNKQGNIQKGRSLLNLAESQGPIPTTHIANTLQGKESIGQDLTNIGGLRTGTDPTDPHAIAAQQYYGALQKYTGGLGPNDKAAFDVIHSQAKDSSGNYIVTPSVFDTPEKAETYLDHPGVLTADTALNKQLASEGQKVDPFFTNLSPAQQKAFLAYQTINKNNTGQLTTWQQNNPWSKGFEQARSVFYNSLPPGDPNKPKNPIQPPTESADVNSLYSQYNNITDPTQRSQFFAAHPALGQYTDAYAKYTNQVLTAQGLSPLKPYPTSDAETSSFTTTYLNASTAQRASLRTSNPDDYAKMGNYLAQTTEWELDRQASIDQLNKAGEQPSQKYLKSAYNLGQYDIAPPNSLVGTSSYSLNPTLAHTTEQAGGLNAKGYKSGAYKPAKSFSFKKPHTARVTRIKYASNRYRVTNRKKSTKVKAKVIK